MMHCSFAHSHYSHVRICDKPACAENLSEKTQDHLSHLLTHQNSLLRSYVVGKAIKIGSLLDTLQVMYLHIKWDDYTCPTGERKAMHLVLKMDKTTLQTLYVTAQWKLVLYRLNSNNFSSLLQRVDAPHLLRYIQSL